MRKDEFPIIDKHVANEINAVLEQIMAEIQSHIGGCGYINDGLDLALKIIDKYTKGERK